jgi:hypothetical protein
MLPGLSSPHPFETDVERSVGNLALASIANNLLTAYGIESFIDLGIG